MSISVPAFKNACIAPGRSGSMVYLAAAPPSDEGRLEVYTVNLSNVNAPTATFLANQTNPSSWSSSAPKACIPFPGNSANVNNPFMLQQFGPKSYSTNIFPNGTIEFSSYFRNTGYISPKLFSLTGAVGNLNWIVGVSNRTSLTTNSPWNGLRVNATEGIYGSLDYIISMYPTGNPLVSVGTYIAATNTPVQGYHVVFDSTGGGVIYNTLNSASQQAGDRIMTLTNAVDVDMNGITLTNNVIPVTMVGVGYLLDQASDGSTVLYSITPSASNKLVRVPLSGNVPPFSPSMTATAMNANIVLYGSSSSTAATATFNLFDTVSKAWTGPGLVAPPPPPPTSGGGPAPTSTPKPKDEGSKSSTGAIIGGVVGALVVAALVAFLFIRHRRKNKRQSQAPVPSSPSSAPGKESIPAATSVQQQQQGYVQQQHQQQHQQQQQQQQQPYQTYYDPGQMSPSQQTQGSPTIFQSPTPSNAAYSPQQQGYNYTPPILSSVPPQQPGQPQIFRPQSEIASQGYSQGGYTPYTPATHAAPSPTYVHQGQHQGYAS
ncbi:hypothetical protein BGZ94_007593 [Podila epigama]|nr:hypothetical protein BGZ94_007593 [Podila epigama]